jgi:hypothetical protein
MKCDVCGWRGRLAECGDVEHDDGAFDCPNCHQSCTDDWEREKLEIIQRIAYLLTLTTDVPAKFMELLR